MRTSKTTIIALAAILIAAVALCSCNLDATDGIYSEIADSTPSTSVTVKAYLGQFNSEYYYLTDSEVCKINDDGNATVLFSSSETEIIRAASLASDGSILILKQNMNVDGTLKGSSLYYNEYSGTAYSDPVLVEGSFNGLLVNGLFYDSTSIYHYDGGKSQIDTGGNVSVQYCLVTGNYALFSVTDTNSDYKIYVIKASDGTKLFDGIKGSSDMTYIGFQPLPSGKDFVLLNYDRSKAKSNLYVLAEGNTEVTGDIYTTLRSSIPYAYGTQTVSFIYTEDEKTYIVFKCSSYFDKVRISADESDGEVSQVSTGFASNLRTTDITNAIETSTAGVFVVGTVDSMLYELDMNHPDKSPRQIK